MVNHKKDEFLKSAAGNMAGIYDAVASHSREIQLGSLERGSSALIIVDMVNGFVKRGALSSPNVLSLNEKIAGLLKACNKLNIPAVCFADTHSRQSAQFRDFPGHCIGGTEESLVTDEIAAGKFELIPKNSTNGFLEPAFTSWLGKNGNIDKFIITGCCTDLCVLQFALALKADFNRRDRVSRVIVPAGLTATYDAPRHSASFIDTMSYYNMLQNGIEVTTNFKY
jgi:nicotinamidase-related amidase